MLLANRRKKPGADGRTDDPAANRVLQFGSPLPDVQINDPRSPLAEALAQIPAAIGSGMQGFQGAQALQQRVADPSANPQGAGLEGPPAPDVAQAQTPLLSLDWLKKYLSARQANPALGG